MVEYVIVMKGQ